MDGSTMAKINLQVTRDVVLALTKEKIQILKIFLHDMSLDCLARNDQTARIKGKREKEENKDMEEKKETIKEERQKDMLCYLDSLARNDQAARIKGRKEEKREQKKEWPT